MKTAFLIYAIAIFVTTPALAHHGKGKGEESGRYCHHETPPPAPKPSPHVTLASPHEGLCGLVGLCW